MKEFIMSMLFSLWIMLVVIGLARLICNIIGENNFIFETFKFKYFVNQIKSLYENGGLYCPFSPDNRKKYTKFGLCILSILWLLTFGIAFIPALILAYIIWACYWIFVKLCIKNVDD